MKPSLRVSWVNSCLVLALFLTSCNLPKPTAIPQAVAAPTQMLEATATLPPATAANEPTATLPAPTETVAVAENTPTPTPGPACTALQDLNFRSGPGTAYRPPLKTVNSGAVVIPLGYNRTGVPGGSWVYVEDPATQEKGWLSAGSQYVSCNLDLASLSPVEVGTPPPPPLPQSAISSTPEGNCDGSGYNCEVIVSKTGWIQFKITKKGKELGKSNGVQQVAFRVEKGGQTVYQHVAKDKPYCIFGSCSWTVEDFTYKWKPGGKAVEPGKYLVSIEATVKGTTLIWNAKFTVTFP